MAGMTAARKQELFTAMAARLPSGRIGRPDDIADAVVFLMKNEFCTGTVLDVDGGHRLV
jgi:NAD(P)-dependent dehydrogenase (short-subunit alcohol dehydrogenase family)